LRQKSTKLIYAAGSKSRSGKKPKFPPPGEEEQHVIRVFIKVAGEAGDGGREVVSEPPFVGRETFVPSKPAKNLAL
jgi:hypothetical protein